MSWKWIIFEHAFLWKSFTPRIVHMDPIGKLSTSRSYILVVLIILPPILPGSSAPSPLRYRGSLTDGRRLFGFRRWRGIRHHWRLLRVLRLHLRCGRGWRGSRYRPSFSALVNLNHLRSWLYDYSHSSCGELITGTWLIPTRDIISRE